jgi:hypothetical protein
MEPIIMDTYTAIGNIDILHFRDFIDRSVLSGANSLMIQEEKDQLVVNAVFYV